jgi:hypothetical protein
MKLFLVGVCSVLLAGPLHAGPTGILASASANGLRVRSDPALSGAIVGSLRLNDVVVIVGKSPGNATIDGTTAPWYRVLTMSGELGWAFGGYLKTGTISLQMAFIDDEGELQPKVEDLSRSFGGGELKHVRLDLGEAAEPSSWPRLEVLFARPPGGTAQVVFAEPAGSEEFGVMERSVDSIEAVDLLGDSRMEICVTFSESGVDYGTSELWVFGQEGTSNRYELFGTLPMSSGEAGDICGETSTSVRSGPDSVVERGQRVLKLVRQMTTATAVGTKDDGTPDCLVVTTVQEETYVLKEGTLILAGTKTLE